MYENMLPTVTCCKNVSVTVGVLSATRVQWNQAAWNTAEGLLGKGLGTFQGASAWFTGRPEFWHCCLYSLTASVPPCCNQTELLVSMLFTSRPWLTWPPPSRMPLSPTSSHILISPIPPSWCKCAFATKLPWSPQCECPRCSAPLRALITAFPVLCLWVSRSAPARRWASWRQDPSLSPTAPLPSPPAPETPCSAMAVLSEGSVTDSKYAFSLQIPSLIFSSIGYPETLNYISSLSQQLWVQCLRHLQW